MSDSQSEDPKVVEEPQVDGDESSDDENPQESSKDVFASYIELVEFVQRNQTNDSRFFKRYTTGDGRHYYQDLRTMKVQWSRPANYVSVEQLATMLHRFYEASRRPEPLSTTIDGVPYEIPRAPLEMPPREALMWQGVDASSGPATPDSRFADALKKESPAKVQLRNRQASVASLIKPIVVGAEGEKDDKKKEKGGSKTARDKTSDSLKQSPSMSKIASSKTENRRSGFVKDLFTAGSNSPNTARKGSVDKNDKDKEKYDKEKEEKEEKKKDKDKEKEDKNKDKDKFGTVKKSATQKDDPIGPVIAKLKEGEGFRNFSRAFFVMFLEKDPRASRVMDGLDDDRRTSLIKHVFEYVDKASKDMSFIMSKEVAARADMYKTLGVPQGMHRAFIDCFIRVLAQLVGKPLVNPENVSTWGFLLGSLSRQMGGPAPSLVDGFSYFNETPSPSTPEHQRKSSGVEFPTKTDDSSNSSDIPEGVPPMQRSFPDSKSGGETPPMQRSMPDESSIDRPTSPITALPVKDAPAPAELPPPPADLPPPEMPPKDIPPPSSAPSPAAGAPAPPPSMPPPPPMLGVENPESDGILFSVQFPTIKEKVLFHFSCAIKSSQGNALMGYLFLTASYVCFATKKNKMAIPFSGVTRVARNETDLLIARAAQNDKVPALAVVFTNFRENLAKVYVHVNDLYQKTNPTSAKVSDDQTVPGNTSAQIPESSSAAASFISPRPSGVSPRPPGAAPSAAAAPTVPKTPPLAMPSSGSNPSIPSLTSPRPPATPPPASVLAAAKAQVAPPSTPPPGVNPAMPRTGSNPPQVARPMPTTPGQAPGQPQQGQAPGQPAMRRISTGPPSAAINQGGPVGSRPQTPVQARPPSTSNPQIPSGAPPGSPAPAREVPAEGDDKSDPTTRRLSRPLPKPGVVSAVAPPGNPPPAAQTGSPGSPATPTKF